MQLTPAGREFVAVAERVLNDLRISVRSMRDLADQQRGQVIVAAIESVATGLLPRIIAEYHIARPAFRPEPPFSASRASCHGNGRDAESR